MPADLRATAEAVYRAEAGKISRWYTSPENAQLRVDCPTGGPVYMEARSTRDVGDSPTGGIVIDTGAALAAIKKAMKVHSLLLPDLPGRVGLLGGHLKAALKALGGGVTDAGGLDNSHAGDDKTQLPSRSWRLEKIAHAENEVMRAAPTSNCGRRLKLERDLAEIRSDLAWDSASTEKAEHHERWRRKDPYAIVTLWRSLELYPKKAKKKEPARDPWVAS